MNTKRIIKANEADVEAIEQGEEIKTDALKSIDLMCSAQIKAAEGGTGLPTFEMLAYTGGDMVVSYFGRIVIDISGVKLKRSTLPVRFQHDPNKGVGHTTEVTLTKQRIKAKGVVSRDTSWARDVLKSGLNGFPWQVSIGMSVDRQEYVDDGVKVNVNGKVFEGPLYVIRQGTLYEVSFVDAGADDQTSARVAAEEQETGMTFEEFLRKKGLVEAQLSKDQRKALLAEYNGEPAPETPVRAQVEEPKVEEPKVEEPKVEEPQMISVSAQQGVEEYRKSVAEESKRISGIRKLCASGYPEIEEKAILEGWSVEKADSVVCKKQLEDLRASRGASVGVQPSRGDVAPAAFVAAALMNASVPRIKLEQQFNEQTLDAAHEMRGVGLQEFCELACGMQLPRFRRDPVGWLQAAFSTTSLPLILSNVANKMLLEGYNYVDSSWRTICKIASVNDFKQHTRYRMTGSFQFLKVGQDGELKHGTTSEQQYTQQADTHGIMFALTRQMMINDDMGAFTDIPRQIGMGAAEAISDAVWTLILSNPSSFFATGNANYATGATTVLSIDSLTTAEQKFLDQTKPNGKPLGILPSILLVPTALKVLAERIMKSVTVNETTTANKPSPIANPHVGKFTVASSPYLSNSSITGYSSTAWYLFADPNVLPAFETAFLNGVDTPTVERADADFNVLGIQFRGYIDFGVKEQDYRGAVKMKGAV